MIFPFKRFKKGLGPPLARTFVARGAAAVGAIFLVLIVGRLHGAQGVGVLALAQSLLLGASLLARTGLDSALMKFVAEGMHSPAVLHYLRWALWRSVAVGVFLSALVWVLRHFFESLFNAEGLGVVLIGISLAIPAYTAGFLLSGFFKGIHKPATACLLENGVVSLVSGGFIIVHFEIFEGQEYAAIGYAYALSAWLIAAIGFYQILRWCRTQSWWHSNKDEISYTDSTAPSVTLLQFIKTSRIFFITNMAGFLYSVLGILIAGWLLSSSELGILKSAQQTAIMVSFILVVMNSIIPPRFAVLYQRGSLRELEALVRLGSVLSVGFSAPFIFTCLFFPEWVLGWFGEEFKSGAILLQIITFSQLINVATGSVAYLLNMTGHEILMRNIALFCSFLGLLAFFVLIPLLGVLGGALAFAVVLITQNLMALFFVWRRLGIWTLPGPNFLSYAGVRAQFGRQLAPYKSHREQKK